MSQLKTKYEEAKVDATDRIPHKFIVNNAKPAEKKVYPIRWLIVLVSTFAAGMLSIIVLLILENIRRVKSAA
jgi:uncharacterized protein involved in exopolysaccharide biosynthesis